MDATQTDEHVKWDDRSCDDGEGNLSETEDEVVQLSATNQINSPVAAIDKDPTESMTLEPNLSRKDACAVSNANAAGSSSIQRFDKRKQDDGTGSSHSMESCKNKRQRIYGSVPNAKSSEDIMCNENDSGVDNQSCNFDNPEPEEGNSTHKEFQKFYKKQVSDISTQSSAGNSMISCSCPDIFDFKTYRNANRFAVGQIWALYDKHDAMPRLYAKIMHFDAHNHKIHLTWLEQDATNKEEEKWTDKKLPVGCGSFRLQPTVDTSQDRFMFSHIVASTKGMKGNSYDIIPNKGEVWALYKGWSKQWSSDTDNHRSYDYEYEVVEVLSTMSAQDGAIVIPLVKIKGFVSLFARAKGMSSFFVPSSELLRFSHSISFYRTNGNEKMGVPRDFLELDTACLPSDLDAAFSSVTLVSYMFLGNMTGCVFADLPIDSADNKMDCGDKLIARKENSLEQNVCQSISADDTDDISSEHTSTQKNGHGATANESGDSSQQNCMSPNTYPYPDPEFHDFEEGRSLKKFKHGQIWAMYSDTDKFPNFYAWIREVEPEPFRVHLKWLEACPQSEQEKRWLQHDLSISCGTFDVRNWRTEYDTSSYFSHLVDARPTGMKWQFEVVPQVGQIWATYMNWAPGWVPPSGDSSCDYVISEIIERTEAGTKLTILTQVGGYRCVFKPDNTKGVLEIPAGENLRFSHRIPSFRLTEEMGGTLRCFYELDPASLPDAFLHGDT